MSVADSTANVRVVQDYEVGLVGVGDGTGAFGKGNSGVSIASLLIGIGAVHMHLSSLSIQGLHYGTCLLLSCGMKVMR